MEEYVYTKETRLVTYAFATFLICIALISLWYRWIDRLRVVSGASNFFSFLFIFLFLGAGLYLVSLPKTSIKSETYKKVMKGNYYFYGGLLIFVAVIGTIYGIIQIVQGNPLFDPSFGFYFFLSMAIIAVVGFFQIYYIESTFGGRKWVRVLLIISSLAIFIKYLILLIAMIQQKTIDPITFVTFFLALLVSGVSFFFFLLNKRIKDFYSN